MAIVSPPLDTSDLSEAIDELRDLLGDATGVPDYMIERVSRMLVEGVGDIEWLETCGVVRPSAELLAVLATLRAHRHPALI